ncbi:hypothetical protein [Neisseria meningitidis]|uniref:hypothetical protein n=1 Tax=Neisseria meningitidis TaxID=487 RepID=UPI0006DCD160|nr:hypothetical protein [Neisseria meningitidis]
MILSSSTVRLFTETVNNLGADKPLCTVCGFVALFLIFVNPLYSSTVRLFTETVNNLGADKPLCISFMKRKSEA